MSDDLPAKHDSPERSRWQYSLRAALLVVLVLSVLLAVASQFPRQSAFTASMLLLLLFPLVVAQMLRMPLVRRGTGLPLRWLGLWQTENAPSLAEGFATALVSTLVLV